MSIVNRIGGYGVWSIFLATKFSEMAAICEREQLPLPFPPQLAEFPSALMTAMSMHCNVDMPSTHQIRVGFMPITMPTDHKHIDVEGNEIPCELAYALGQQDHYGLVGAWENDAGNTQVSTTWIGDEDAVFETRVFSSDPALHGRTMGYKTKAEAEVGHEAMVGYIQYTMPE